MNSLIQRFVGVWLHPWNTLAGLKQEENSIKPALIFVVTMGFLIGLISAIVGFISPPVEVVSGQLSPMSVLLAILLGPIIAPLSSFAIAFIVWILVGGLIKGTSADYKLLFRVSALVSAFSVVNALLVPIPKAGPILAIAINIWTFVVLIRGVIILMETPALRTWISLIVSFLFIILFLLLLNTIAAQEMQRQAMLGGPGMGEFGGFDALGDEEALNRELQELAERARTEATPAAIPRPR